MLTFVMLLEPSRVMENKPLRSALKPESGEPSALKRRIQEEVPKDTRVVSVGALIQTSNFPGSTAVSTSAPFGPVPWKFQAAFSDPFAL